MEEKFFVEIKDDYGKVRVFEVPALEMKIAIDNIDKELKEQSKHDAMNYAICFSQLGPNAEEWFADDKDTTDYTAIYKLRCKILYKALWNVVKNMENKQHKQILNIRYQQGLQFNEIAKYLGCSKQNISKIYDTIIVDLRTLLNNDPDFTNTPYYRHIRGYGEKETRITIHQEIRKPEDLKKYVSEDNIENVKEFVNDVKDADKRHRKLGLTKEKFEGLKKEKFKLFGMEFTVADMFKVVGDFLDDLPPKTKENA